MLYILTVVLLWEPGLMMVTKPIDYLDYLDGILIEWLVEILLKVFFLSKF
jgi:hypothetical protein